MVVVFLSGCLIDRAPIGGARDGGRLDAPGLDAPGLDAPGLDAPAADGWAPCASPADCDDGEPCTDDACEPTGCVHRNNTAPCDDGILCNGGDSCGAGSCSVHDGVDPCTAPLRCDAAMDRCLGCTDASQCPDPIEAFGACTFPPGELCVEEGTRTRTVTTFSCESSVCVPSERTESERCTRETDGLSCGPDIEEPYGACVYADPICGVAGTRTRTVTRSSCTGGVCVPASMVEIDRGGCGRTTDGAACAGGCDAWSACERDDPSGCSRDGTHRRSCREGQCSGGTCQTVRETMEVEGCRVDALSGLPCTPSDWCTPCATAPFRCPRGETGSQQCSDESGSSCNGFGLCIDSSPYSQACMCP